MYFSNIDHSAQSLLFWKIIHQNWTLMSASFLFSVANVLIPLPTYFPFGFNLYGFHRSLVTIPSILSPHLSQEGKTESMPHFSFSQLTKLISIQNCLFVFFLQQWSSFDALDRCGPTTPPHRDALAVSTLSQNSSLSPCVLKRRNRSRNWRRSWNNSLWILVKAKAISTPVTLLTALWKRGLIIPTHSMMMMTFGGWKTCTMSF